MEDRAGISLLENDFPMERAKGSCTPGTRQGSSRSNGFMVQDASSNLRVLAYWAFYSHCRFIAPTRVSSFLEMRKSPRATFGFFSDKL
jgi:hypothetical protein